MPFWRKSGFGRAHHRVVHFVNRNPGMTVADLLDTLKITKQSLARVLKQLIDRAIFDRLRALRTDGSANSIRRRQGANWRFALAEPQSRRIERAFDGASPEIREGVKAFLKGMRKQKQNAKAD